MALDGMVIADMAYELNRDLTADASQRSPSRRRMSGSDDQAEYPSGRRKDTAQSEASCTFGQSESSVDL